MSKGACSRRGPLGLGQGMQDSPGQACCWRQQQQQQQRQPRQPRQQQRHRHPLLTRFCQVLPPPLLWGTMWSRVSSREEPQYWQEWPSRSRMLARLRETRACLIGLLRWRRTRSTAGRKNLRRGGGQGQGQGQGQGGASGVSTTRMRVIDTPLESFITKCTLLRSACLPAPLVSPWHTPLLATLTLPARCALRTRNTRARQPCPANPGRSPCSRQQQAKNESLQGLETPSTASAGGRAPWQARRAEGTAPRAAHRCQLATPTGR